MTNEEKNNSAFKFLVGERWSSENKSYEELVAVVGKPVADAIFFAKEKSGGNFVVNNVNTETKTITISQLDPIVDPNKVIE